MGWGGQELRILHESRGMLERGHEVMIACPPNAQIFAAATRMQIPVTGLPMERRNLAALRSVFDFLRQHDFDVINTHSSTDSWLFATASRLTRSKASLVRTRHISSKISRDLLTRWVYRYGVKRVITTGEALRQQLIRDNRLPENHVISVPTGIDTMRFIPGDKSLARQHLQLPTNRTIVGIVATMRYLKGHLDLVEAAARLNRDHLWIFVGDGPSRRVIEDKIASLGLEQSVLLVGNQTDVVPWLQAMDLFVLPSYAEGVPQAVMQASSCGLPVVSTNVGGIPEIVRDGETGKLIPPGDVDQLVKAIEQILSDQPMRVRWAAQGRQLAMERFGIEKMLDRMEKVFYSVSAHQALRAAS